MHLKRQQAPKQFPIPRKGMHYVARAAGEGVPVVIAVRDMLGLAHTAKEVKKIINSGILKINGRKVEDMHEAIGLFNILEADKKYRLSVLKTGKFYFEEVDKDELISKVTGKKVLPGNKVQLNMHDGTNIQAPKDKKIDVGDTVILGFDKKVKDVIPFAKGKPVFVASGANVGLHGTIREVEKTHAIIHIAETDKEVRLEKSHAFAYHASPSNK